MTDDELIYTRVLPAPRDLVFACMTQTEHLAAFWGPHGTSTPLDGIVVELRVGGRFETLMISGADGSTYRMRAVFDEITPPSRLVWTDIDTGVVTTTTYTDLGESTEVRIHQQRVPEPMRTPQAQAGFLTSLDRFAEHLDHLTGRTSP